MDKIDNLISIGEAILRILTERKAQDDIPLNRQQAACYLGVHPHTIDNYRRTGRLEKCVRHGIEGFLSSDLDKLK